MKKIWVLYTGGTIGMVQGERGLQPDTALVETAFLPYQDQLYLDWHICQPLIDSSAITPENWSEWIQLIQEKLPEYDGILILHGTDTLAYTANILALTVVTAGKPIVLTGSQKPFGSENSDARKNLDTAIHALLNPAIQEVVIAFDGECYPAVGSNKISTEVDQGFANAHFGKWKENNAFPLRQHRRFDEKVKIQPILLTPGASMQLAVEGIQVQKTDAIIILAYGHGNAPYHADFLSSIQTFTQQGGLALIISQAWQGCAEAVYAQGDALRRSGAISAGKCNLETAIALLSVAISHQWTEQDIQAELLRLNLIDPI